MSISTLPFRVVASLCFSATCLIGCEPQSGAGDDGIVVDSGAADALIEEQTVAFLRARPNLASYLDLTEAEAGGPYAARLPDYSVRGFRDVRTLEVESAEELAAVSREGLDGTAALNLDIVETIHRHYAGFPPTDYGYIDWYYGQLPYIVNQMNGPAIDVPKVMTDQQRIRSKSDVSDYLTRLEALGAMIDGVRGKFTADLELGVIPPRAIREGAAAILDGFVRTDPAEHALVKRLASAMDSITELTSDERVAHAAQATRTLEVVVLPSYRALADALRTQDGRAPEGDGIWAQPDGAALYEHLVRSLGDTDLTPPEVHEIGLVEVERISREMDVLLRSEGFSDGSVSGRVAEAFADPGLIYPDSDAGRDALLDALNEQIVEMERLLPTLFASIPTQRIEVARVPEALEAGAPGGYYSSPSLDGERPGIYWINLRDMAEWPKPALPTLTYHEATPGHHFQMALNLAQEDLPLLRRNAPFNAYIEGWALYAELLAWELDLYRNDPLGDLGRLRDELFRAVRLVVDTGLHFHRWTREEAIEYVVSTTGMPRGGVETEVDRYMALPGQALGYKLGMLKLVELRDYAQAELGDGFDVREFHDVVLLEGALPMSVLERRVREWAASH